MKRFLIYLSIALVGLTSCQKSLKQIVKEAEKATFIIYTYDEFGSPSGLGSGFFIDKNGTGITNYHVLDGAVKAIIKMTDDMEYEIENVIASNKQWDIAKFQIKNPQNQTFPTLKFSNKEAQKGEKVYNISSPLGLEHSVSEGIVSSLREDKHGAIIQITAPISSGSSGSPILNEKGEVVAVATFQTRSGQNLNFGVIINENKLLALKDNPFAKSNPKFNSMDNFIILNIPSDRAPEIILNAIEFGKSATTLYITYTNLNLMGGDSYGIWCELNKKDDGFLIHDKNKNKKYYVTSSTIGLNKDNYTNVPLATTHKFKVYFPSIKDKLSDIDVVYGYTSRGWQFTNINLDEYRNSINVNPQSYQREYAFSIMREGELDYAQYLLLECLENEPDDVNSLNALGIISYVIDNNNDALYYLTEAIEQNPNNATSYINRHYIYASKQNYSAALYDITKAINICPDQPDNFLYRALLYMDMEDWKNAKVDLDKVIASEDFKKDAMVYVYRVYANAYLENWREACKDIHTAYNLTNDRELEKELQGFWNSCGCNRY